MTPQPVILFLDVGIQIEIDPDGFPLVLEYAQGTEVDPVALLFFRRCLCFCQRIKCSAHDTTPRVVLDRAAIL